MLCLKPPNPAFWGGFFKITFHEQSPIFKAHFFKQNYINLLHFQGNFFRNLLSRRIFKNTFDRAFFYKITLYDRGLFFFCGTAPPHPQVKDCLPVCRGGGGVPVHRWILLHLYLPIYLLIFVNKKLVIFYSVNLWWIIAKLKTDGLFLILISG